MNPMDLKIGQVYKISFTHPRWDGECGRFLPDTYRFVDPEIVTAVYGGRCRERHRCCVCLRYGGRFCQFLDLGSGEELFISEHCLSHDSTQVWDRDTEDATIEKVYDDVSLRLGAEDGDGLAGFALALRRLEARQDECE